MSSLFICVGIEDVFNLHEIACVPFSDKSWSIDTNSEPGQRIKDNLYNLQEYFEEKYYNLYRGRFQPYPPIKTIPDNAPSIFLGIFLSASMFFRLRRLRDDWDSIIVTGDVSYNPQKNKEVELVAVDCIDGKYTAAKEYAKTAASRKVLFVYIGESDKEWSDVVSTDSITVKRFTEKNAVNEILDLVFEPYDFNNISGRLLGNDTYGMTQKRLLNVVECDPVLTKSYIRPDDFENIEKTLEKDATWRGYFIYGEGQSGKTATAYGITRYLVLTGIVYAPLWIRISNEEFARYIEENKYKTSDEITASDKYICTRIYNLLLEKDLSHDNFNKELLKALRKELDKKRFLIVVDNLELERDKIELVLQTLKNIRSKAGSNKPYIIITSRKLFDDTELIDKQGIKIIRPPELKKNEIESFVKNITRGNFYYSKIEHSNSDEYETLIKLISEEIGGFPGVIIAFIGLLMYVDVHDLIQLLSTNMGEHVGEHESRVEKILVRIYHTAFEHLDQDVRNVLFFVLVLGPDNIKEKKKIITMVTKRTGMGENEIAGALVGLKNSCLVYTIGEKENERYGIRTLAFLTFLFNEGFYDEKFYDELQKKERFRRWWYLNNWRLRKALRYDQPVRLVGHLLEKVIPSWEKRPALNKNFYLFIAVRNTGNREVLTLLQKAGCDINAAGIFRLTPFFYAIAYNLHNNVKDVLDWFENNEGYEKKQVINDKTAMQYAAAFTSNVEVLQWLEDNGYRTKDDSGITLLNRAVSNNDCLEVIRHLCEKADIHQRDEKGRVPLHCSASSCVKRSILAFLIDEKTINSPDGEDQSTPLHYAAISNTEPDVIRFLIDNGANIRARDASGDTPLHNAAACNTEPKVIEALLEEYPSGIKERNVIGETPLHIAAANTTSPGVIAVLLKHGADIHARTIYGETPLDYARDNTNREIAVVLRQYINF